PIPGGRVRKRVVGILAAADVTAHPLSQAIFVVTVLADWQEIAVLGIEDEQEPIEKDQGCFPDFLQGGGRCSGGDRLGELWEDRSEDQIGEILGDAFFIKSPLVDRALVEGARIARRRQEGVAAKNEGKNP